MYPVLALVARVCDEWGWARYFRSMWWMLLWACVDAPAPEVVEPPAVRPDVVWISLDTVRADVLGAWGGSGGLSPRIDAFASQAVVFEGVAAAPTTLAAHTSLMTGTYPHTHGVPRNEHRVHDKNRMVAEVLQAAGWHTTAVLGAMPLGPHSGFPQGFDVVDDAFDRLRDMDRYQQTERDGSEVTRVALAALDARPADRPVFLFAHYFDAHQPLEPEQAAREQVGVSRASATFQQVRRRSVSDAALERLYRAEIVDLDRHVGDLLEGLKARGMGEAVVLITADHGETYAVHDEQWDHGLRTWQETVRVPIALRAPGVAARTESAPISQVDVAPTLLGLLGLPVGDVEGRDLSGALRAGAVPATPLFSEATKPNQPPLLGWHNRDRTKSVQEGRFKLHWEPGTDRLQLFDLQRDPDERRDIAPEHPKEVARLKALLDTWVDQARPLSTERVSDQDAIEALKALGYVE